MAFKAFNKDMTCNGKQYAENTVFNEPEADLCRCGMHYCENPMDVLNFYDLVTNDGDLVTAAEVEPLGKVETDGVKSVTTKLKIGAKLSFPAFIKAGVDFLIEHTKTEVKSDGTEADRGKEKSQIGSSGDWAKIGSSGKNSVICCAGHGCAVKAKKGSWITLAEWDNVNGEYIPVCVKTEQVDGERIKEDTLYRLKGGEFMEVHDE